MLENIFNLEMLIISVGLYLIGSIPFAIISAKLFNLPDPRSFGSKNPGATNVLRSGNKYAAFLTLVGDGLKGLIPVLFLMETTIPVYQIYLLSFFLLVGHTFPVTLNFKGGKGVATSIGILLSLNPIVAALLISFIFSIGEILDANFTLITRYDFFIIVYLAIFASAATFLLIQYAAIKLPSVKVMAHTYLTPSWVIVWYILMGNEGPSASDYIGIFFTIIALFLLLKEQTKI